MLAQGQWIFEWNNKFKQVGNCCGKIVDPHGRDINCAWADGVTESIPRNLVRIAPAPGAKFGDYTLISYSADGVEVAIESEGSLYCTPATKRKPHEFCFCTPHHPCEEPTNAAPIKRKEPNPEQNTSPKKKGRNTPTTKEGPKPTPPPANASPPEATREDPKPAVTNKMAWDKQLQIQAQINQLESTEQNKVDVRT